MKSSQKPIFKNRCISVSNPFVFSCGRDVLGSKDQDILHSHNERDIEKNRKVRNKSISSKGFISMSSKNGDAPFLTDSNDVIVDPICDKSMLRKKQHYFDDQSLYDFISKKRSIFLVEYSLNIKRQDLHNLENLAQVKEEDLINAEKLLEEDATNFDDFLRSTNIITQKALTTADECGKEKLNKNFLIKNINNDIVLLRTDISKNQDILLNLEKYESFLETLALSMMKPHIVSSVSISLTISKYLDEDNLKNEQAAESIILSNSPDLMSFFTSPRDILMILSDLEENNLSLILNSQDIEETLDSLNQASMMTKNELTFKASTLSNQISLIQNILALEFLKVQDLDHKAKMFSYGEFKEEDQEHLHKIDLNVQTVYNHCIGHNEANISTIQMLSSIENRVEEIFDSLENLPIDKVKTAEFSRAKERRLQIREKKIREERFIQDERIKKSLARSNASPSIYNGKKLNFRSNPSKQKKFEPRKNDMKEKFEEEQAYFFS